MRFITKRNSNQRYLIICCAILLLQCISVFAQTRTITGTVYNGITSKPISGATVKAKGVQGSVTSAANGEFSLAIPDTMETVLFADFAEMEVMEIKVINSEVIDIYLSEINLPDLSFQDLLKIKVSTASKQEKSVQDVAASVVVITQSDIQKYGYSSLEEILAHIPGLYLIDDYYWLGSKNYGVRGFYTNEPFNNMILMVNDVNQMEEYSRGAPLTKVNVPVEAIDRIEVIRGPMSVIYGSGAFLGAINIITSKNEQTKISASLGSENSQKIFLRYFDSPTKNQRFSVTSSYYKTDGLNVPYTDLTTNPIQENGNTYLINNGLNNNSTTEGKLKEQRFYCNTNFKTKKFTFDAAFTNNNCGMFDGQPSLGSGNYFINNSVTLMAQLDENLSKHLALRIKETYSNYSDRINYEQDYLNTNKGSNQISSFIESEINLISNPTKELNFILGLYNRYITNYEWWGNYNLNSGPKFKDFMTTIEGPSMVNALFLQGTYNATNKFSVVFGGRIEQLTPFEIKRANDLDTTVIVRNYTYNYSNINFMPQLAVIFKANKSNTIKLLYGNAIKQPSMASIQPYTLHPDWQILEPSRIFTYELNYLSHLTKYLSSNLSLFYNNIENLINRKDVTNPDGTITIQSSNSGEINSLGFEFGFQLKPTDKLFIDLSGTYQKSTDKTTGMENIELGYSPKLLGYSSVSYRIHKKLSVALSYRYIDKMYSYYENTSDYVGRIGFNSPAYSALDFNIFTPYIWKNISLKIKVSNVLNTRIHYPTTLAGYNWDRGTVDSPRMYYFTIEYNFAKSKE